MSEIKVERDPSQERLDELGVFGWPARLARLVYFMK